MYEFHDKPKDKQPIPSKPKSAAEKRPRQAGDRVKLAAFGDKYASQSLTDVDRVMPEKMRMREEQPGKPMKSVKPGTYSGSEKSPDKLMELETDTGKAEIGYDRNRMNTVVSFTQDEQTGKGRQVVENKSLVKRSMGASKFRSNDRSFQNGAMSLRVDGNTNPRLLRRQLHKGSDKEDPTTLDRVIPFHTRSKTEKNQRYKLLDAMHGNEAEKTAAQDKRNQGMSKAVTALSTMEGQKARMEMEFRQKFDKAIKKSRSIHQSDDMDIILQRKKRLILEAIAHGELLELSELASDNTGFEEAGFEEASLEKAGSEKAGSEETGFEETVNTESEVREGSDVNGATEPGVSPIG